MLKSMGIKYMVVGVGEFVVKARLPSTRSHRKFFIPLVAALQKRADIVLLTHDESNMTVNLSQAKAYGEIGKPCLDERKKSGAGKGGRLRPFFLLLSNRLLAQELECLRFST
jgi:hypothetical protein